MSSRGIWRRGAAAIGVVVTVFAATASLDAAARPADEIAEIVGAISSTRAAAQQPDTVEIPLAEESRIWLEGGSTLRSFSCDAGGMESEVRADRARTPLRIDRLAGAVTGASLRIPVGELDCSNDTMNDHMWKALQREAHPTIQFRLLGYAVEEEQDGTTLVDMSGEVTIAGSTRTLTITARADRTPEGGLHMVGSSQLDMTEFDVDPPSLFLGTIRVHDEVTVHFDLVLEPGSADP